MNEIQKILAYYQQFDLETISQQDFEDWINSLEEPMRSDLELRELKYVKAY